MSDAALLDRPPSWQGQIKAEVKKYDADDVIVVRRKERVGKGLRSFCRRRRQCNEMILKTRTIDAGWGGVIGDDPRPLEIVTSRHNLLVNAGIQRALDLLIVAGGQGYNNANSRIGVGDDSTAASASQTDLQAAAGSTHRQFEVMDATFPSRSSQTVTWRSTFTSGEGNFTAGWQEWCIDPGTAASTAITTPMLNRKVAALGTKVAGAVWQFSVTLTLS